MVKKNFYLFHILFVVIFQNIDAQNLFLGDINKSLDKHGVYIELGYTGEVFSNLYGGIEKKTVYLDNFDLIFEFDLKKIFGWKGTTINTYFLGNQGGIPSEYSGAIQGISNIAAHDTWKLYEFWLEQHLFNNKLSILFGLYDLNSEFDTRETSALFINPSHGIGAEFSMAGENGPSIFPTTSLALRMKYNLYKSLNIKMAVFDGVPGDLNNPNGTEVILDEDEGVLFSTEISYGSESEELNKDYFKYSVGGWYYTNEFAKLLSLNNEISSTQKGNYGLYISAEKFILSESSYNNQGLTGFFRAGISDKNVNQVNGYLGVGVNYSGLISGRDNDVLGIALALAHNSENYIKMMQIEDPKNKIEKFEYIFELTYHVSLFEFLSIQPDIQYIINPAQCHNNRHSIMFGTRLQLIF